MKDRAHRTNDSRRYYDWIVRAEVDLLSAKALMNDKQLYISSAFHCQQCVEKILKGYLLFNTNKLVDGHNLTWLCRQAMKFDEKFSDWLDESIALNKYYIETRYPTDFPFEISDDVINKVYKMTNDMYTFIFSEIIGEEFSK
ncbi:MAG: HEPN domain-containing protein [Oscillospiraceae bacterium]